MNKWYIPVLKRYWDFDGRATRKEFWMFVLISGLVQISIYITVRVISGSAETASLFENLYVLAVLLPAIGLAMRRMHDIGRNGTWVFFPIVNFIFYCLKGQPHDNQYGPNPKASALSETL
jgi:uncharacterized membrane protein YhaH (DUF805 family)